MTGEPELGVDVWFKNIEGHVFKKSHMITIPRVGDTICLNEDEALVIKVAWNNYVDVIGRETWVVLIDVNTYFSIEGIDSDVDWS
tara:strand:- start:21675 stop:21929 length:255 start_codon:yes stop_codon:yes gene_type:complete